MKKKIYVIAEYGVFDGHYHDVNVYTTEAEANAVWASKRKDLMRMADKNELEFFEFSPYSMEVCNPEDTLGNFTKLIYYTFEV